MSFCKNYSWTGINKMSETLGGHMFINFVNAWEAGGVLEAEVQEWKESLLICSTKSLADATQYEQVQIPVLGYVSAHASAGREWDRELWV